MTRERWFERVSGMKINTDSANAEAIRWWSEARFGMFVHFGLYALLGRGEWVMYHEKIPRHEYEKLVPRFNPSRFDADAWVGLAQEAGARYITVTAKHHDGFCLFDSALTEHKITNTPFGRDLIGELAEACHRQDMRIVFYYSQPDWHHPGFVNRRGAFKEWQEACPEDAPDWAAYQEYLEGQVRELCTNYGRIDGIWWDGTHRSEADWRGRRLYKMIKAYHPHAVVNDRARHGDFYTPERSIPELPVGVPCECCQSVSPKSWGYRDSVPYWSGPALVESLVRTASLGANFLLNVGPRPDGTISPEEQERMRFVGAWLQTNGPAVYGTEGCMLSTGNPRVKVTRKANSLYLHLLQWPETDWLEVNGIGTQPRRVSLLGHSGDLRVEQTEEGLRIGPLPTVPPGAEAAVLEVEFASEPDVSLESPPSVERKVSTLRSDGPVKLSVAEAEPDGYGVKAATLRVTERMQPDGTRVPVVGNFLSEEQTLTWRIRCEDTGPYQVAAETRVSEPYGGSIVQVTVGDQSVSGPVQVNAEGEAFRRTVLGTVMLEKGEHDLVLNAPCLALGYTLGGCLRGLVVERDSPPEGEASA